LDLLGYFLFFSDFFLFFSGFFYRILSVTIQKVIHAAKGEILTATPPLSK